MVIKVEHEDIEELKKWGLGLSELLEHCHFCNVQTRYWHRATNTPVCEECSKVHTVAELKQSKGA